MIQSRKYYYDNDDTIRDTREGPEDIDYNSHDPYDSTLEGDVSSKSYKNLYGLKIYCTSKELKKIRKSIEEYKEEYSYMTNQELAELVCEELGISYNYGISPKTKL